MTRYRRGFISRSLMNTCQHRLEATKAAPNRTPHYSNSAIVTKTIGENNCTLANSFVFFRAIVLLVVRGAS